MTLRLGTRACRVIVDESVHKRMKKKGLGAAPSTVIHRREGKGRGDGSMMMPRGWDRTRRAKVTVTWNEHYDG